MAVIIPVYGGLDEAKQLLSDTLEMDWAAGGDVVVARLDEATYSSEGEAYVKVFVKNKKKKRAVFGYMPKDAFDALNVSTVSIPANFAGLETEMVPTRLQEQYFRIVEVVEDEDCVTITARHVWYDNLENYTIWKPTEDTNYTAAAVCRNIMTNAISTTRSRVASDCTDTKVGKDLDFERKNLVEAFLDPEKGVCAAFGLSLIRILAKTIKAISSG